jgi:high-affinity Fe2+/Pb2+ permease
MSVKLFLCRQRPRPTTRGSEVVVLVTGMVRDWSTHIIIGMTWLAIVGIVLLMLRRVRISEIHVFVWGVDEL